MKKIVFILAMVLIALVSNAQGWEAYRIPADEFTGTPESIAFVYTNDVGELVFWANNDGQYRIATKQGFFNYKSAYSGDYGAIVKIGIYDSNDKLIDKFDMWLDCDRNDDGVNELHTRNRGGMINPVGQGKKVKKILKHLKEKTGYVRFYCDLYGNNPDVFDFKVQCKHNTTE